MELKIRASGIGRLGLAGFFILALGCNTDNGNQPTPPSPVNDCVSGALTFLPGNPSTGQARVFSPDPIVASGISSLSPTSSQLDSFASSVSLSNLSGQGVLKGSFVNVREGLKCDGGYHAFDASQNFSYAHSDSRFQEAMAYYWGDQYLSSLNAIGYLQPLAPVQLWAHCMKEDNAFYTKARESSGQVVDVVCLGDSTATPGAYYSDDAAVIVHELQHATTTETYANPGGLNQFQYDEAGAMNEAISDFMALMFTHPYLTSAFDPMLFSRWALGTFIPNHKNSRGAHKCPAYDPSYPNCGSFPTFSAQNNTISYVYPDGLGWPYANQFAGPGYVSKAFSTSKVQEEIHNAGVLFAGALWDVYDGLLANYGGSETQARMLSSKVVLEAIKLLPKPTSASRSPVTFRGFADQMVAVAPAVGLTAQDQAAMVSALTARGLYGGTLLGNNWGTVGPGKSATPGLRIQDNPTLIKEWLLSILGGDGSALVPQGVTTGLNSQLDPNELVAVWFDLLNNDAQTAGGVELTVKSLDPDVTFESNPDLNRGLLGSDTAQIRYGKVNGTNIVTALTSSNQTYHVGTGNSYFRTNPFFDSKWTTALWVRVGKNAAHGKVIHFQVSLAPTNGPVSVIDFPATIH